MGKKEEESKTVEIDTNHRHDEINDPACLGLPNATRRLWPLEGPRGNGRRHCLQCKSATIDSHIRS